MEGLASQPPLLERRSGGELTYGDSPILPLIKHLLYLKALEETSRRMWEEYIWPGINREKT